MSVEKTVEDVQKIHIAKPLIGSPRGGCMQVLGDGREEVPDGKGGMRIQYYTIYCDKVRASVDSALCPHHEALIEGTSDVKAAASKRRNDGKARKQLLRSMLPDSPLAAINPDFIKSGR